MTPTPKEKAKELVCRMWGVDGNIDYDKILLHADKYAIEDAKQCALICVDEIMKRCTNINLTPPIHRLSDDNYVQYWNEVKQEIEKL